MFKLRLHSMLLLNILLFTSCVFFQNDRNKMSFAEGDLKLTEEWIYTENLEGLKYNNQIINRPPGVEQLLMELTLPNENGLNFKKHCVFYRAPYKDKVGLLKVQEIKNEISCPANSEKGLTFLEFIGIRELKLNFSNYKLSVEFKYQTKDRKMEIPMPNIKMGVVHEKYYPMREKRLLSGFKLVRLSSDSFNLDKNRYLGKVTDKFSKGSAIRCYQVGKNCEMIGEDRCSQCRYGSYEVVDYQCPQGGSRFCGQDHCGEKNEPACPRGTKVVEAEDLGICQSDLSPVRNGDDLLVCQ